MRMLFMFGSETKPTPATLCPCPVSWNALSLERVISAIVIIGLIGLLLDRALEWLTRRVSYAS